MEDRKSSLGQLSLIDEKLDQYGLKLADNGRSVIWKSDNPRHPRNWSTARKVYDAFWICYIECRTRHEYGISETLAIFIFVSLHLIGQGLGSIVFPPYSEVCGRKNLYVISTALFGITCAMVAIPSPGGAVIGRLLSGILGAIPTTVVAGSIEDMFNSRYRIWVIAVWTVSWNIGSALGPIYSDYIIEALDWRWIFYVAAIISGAFTIMLLTIRESRPPLVLEREIQKLPPSIRGEGTDALQSFNPDQVPDLTTFVAVFLMRPLRLLATEPIVFLVSILGPIPYAITYLFSQSLPDVYESLGFTTNQAHLPLFAICVGVLFILPARWYNDYRVSKHTRLNRPITPEHQLLGLIIAAPVLAGGMWLFSWTIPPLVPGVHWIVPTIGLVCVGYAGGEFPTVLAGYLSDSYRGYSSSAFAALALVRVLLAATFPLFSPDMFANLGPNVAVTVLAAIATVFCAVPPLLKAFGERIRARSSFAKESLVLYSMTTVDKEGF
ncbi:putative MFS transporter [Aspergillus steynii IBT 23096]|uniref:Putative MFS transporter n=1 Tax=Aspergillus steynii IBT 23096 TaxID=1392250 RepID=A0A2I2GKP5_9EURO|nr:putative MFS transporter [Aspergillus steynii IBT 23096]PLB53451.1 putative MFS transporter [Aspergillus steynii IBT 23096]